MNHLVLVEVVREARESSLVPLTMRRMMDSLGSSRHGMVFQGRIEWLKTLRALMSPR